MSGHRDVYPVGVLYTLKSAARAVRRGRWESARREFRKEWSYIKHQVTARNWRAIRNSFNGYLAEHDGHPHNCGRGWTKRAAERRAERICRATYGGAA